MSRERERRKETTEPPERWQTFKWYDPGLWMVRAVGSGAVLFTPRVGARYGYEFLWMAIIVIFFMRVI